MLPEVPERGRLDAVQSAAEVHLVHIELEDLPFRVLPFDAGREDDFLQFAPEGYAFGVNAIVYSMTH